VDRFIAEGESILRARLEAYGLEVILTDADRTDVDSGVYTLPSGLITVRHVIRDDGTPLTSVDETLIAFNRTLTTQQQYCVRPTTIVIAGTPAEESEIALHYFGIPAPLDGDNDTNTLLSDYPGLYKDLGMVGVYERASNLGMAQAKLQKANSLIDEINRAMKKKLGGKQAANAYNVGFRSSY
jgi:hypothetical protein